MWFSSAICPGLQIFACITVLITVGFAQTSTNAPLVFPASGQWDGLDGPWSTFNLGVGDPIQSFRCVPALSSTVVLIPVQAQGCNSSSSEVCHQRTTFFEKNSTTWRTSGAFYIPLSENLRSILSNFDTDTKRGAIWGEDNVYLGHNANRDLGVARQPIGEVTSLEFFVGVFGLASGALQLGASPDPTRDTPTLLTHLCTSQKVPSCSLSYTAGSARKNTTGSLILGGYDTSRFNASTSISVPMPSGNASLIVAVQSISIVGKTLTTWVAPSKSWFQIESLVPEIWLPPEACAVFEQAFGLTWDVNTEFYTVNETTRARLLEENPTVSFSISDGGALQKPKDFTLPYSAFDLQLKPPLVVQNTYYFPLKRATNSSQYVLGRAFLQETHVTVDYGRANFSLSQAYSAGGSGYIVPISNATANRPNNTTTNNPTNSGSSMSSGAYAGIGVGVGIFALLIASLLISWKKGRGIFHRKFNALEQFDKSELHGDDKPRLEVMGKERVELADVSRLEAMDRETAELETVEPSHEAACVTSPTVHGLDLVHELSGDQVRRSESTL